MNLCFGGKQLVKAGLDQITTESDVDIHIITVDGIVTLSLIQTHPNLIILPQLQHQTLALHDATVTGLSIENDFLLVIPHDVHVGLLEIPGVDIETEKIQACHIAVELALKHVEVAIEVHKDSVKDQSLVAFITVESFLPAH